MSAGKTFNLEIEPGEPFADQSALVGFADDSTSGAVKIGTVENRDHFSRPINRAQLADDTERVRFQDGRYYVKGFRLSRDTGGVILLEGLPIALSQFEEPISKATQFEASNFPDADYDDARLIVAQSFLFPFRSQLNGSKHRDHIPCSAKPGHRTTFRAYATWDTAPTVYEDAPSFNDYDLVVTTWSTEHQGTHRAIPALRTYFYMAFRFSVPRNAELSLAGSAPGTPQ